AVPHPGHLRHRQANPLPRSGGPARSAGSTASHFQRPDPTPPGPRPRALRGALLAATNFDMFLLAGARWPPVGHRVPPPARPGNTPPGATDSRPAHAPADIGPGARPEPARAQAAK